MLKETSITVVPILLIVFLLDLTVAPIGWALLGKFFIGGFLIIIGLSVFLLGTDIVVLPVGQGAGSALVHKRNLGLMLAVGFLIGFLVTIAEPDVQVLASQVSAVDSSISKIFLLVMIALGVGFFVASDRSTRQGRRRPGRSRSAAMPIPCCIITGAPMYHGWKRLRMW